MPLKFEKWLLDLLIEQNFVLPLIIPDAKPEPEEKPISSRDIERKMDIADSKDILHDLTLSSEEIEAMTDMAANVLNFYI